MVDAFVFLNKTSLDYYIIIIAVTLASNSKTIVDTWYDFYQTILVAKQNTSLLLLYNTKRTELEKKTKTNYWQNGITYRLEVGFSDELTTCSERTPCARNWHEFNHNITGLLVTLRTSALNSLTSCCVDACAVKARHSLWRHRHVRVMRGAAGGRVMRQG